MIRNVIIRNRSYRRFYQEVAIDRETLRELLDLARLSAYLIEHCQLLCLDRLC